MRWAGALALGALVLYPGALALPMLRIERFGHDHETTIWGGVVSLVRDGHLWVGLLVFACSVVAPVVKLITILALSWRAGGAIACVSAQTRRRAHAAVELIGRWGMLDVMLVAVLVAAVKLGDLMSVRAGPGVALYAGMVVLSLLASWVFDPRAIREQEHSRHEPRNTDEGLPMTEHP